LYSSAEGEGTHSAAVVDPLPGPARDDIRNELLSLLEQISHEAGAEESTGSEQAHPGDEADAKSVVGTTAEELEPFNELIQFDHVYFKPSAPSVPAAKKNISILKPTLKKPAAQPQPQPQPTQDLPEPFQIPDEDIVSLSQTLEGLIDLDALVTDACKGTPSPSVPVDNSRKRKAESDIAPVAVKKESPCDFVFSDIDSSSFLCGSEQFGLEASLSGSADGYCSDSSDPVLSPKSENASELGLDGSWEESFTELFPSLI
jgi:hypothetical protein